MNFGLIPIDILTLLTDGFETLDDIKPTLWNNIFIVRIINSDKLVPLLRIPDKNFIDNGKVEYKRIKSFNGIC